jgi:teichuronic acid biosynthesis glycosyltransferase TuaC
LRAGARPSPGALPCSTGASLASVRALVVTTLYPTRERPSLGVFVRDQVRELSKLPDVELELFTFRSAGARSYVDAARNLRRRYRGVSFDVVHAHFGLTAWPALAVANAPHAVTLHGTDLSHPRSRAITLAALPLHALVAPVSEELAATVPRRLVRQHLEVLPCGVDTDRFHPIPRTGARRALGLDPEQRFLLFPSDPARPEKRYDRARLIAGDLPLHVVREVDPEQVPLWVNAADAVIVPSEREGFGLAVLEALACNVPVLATPVGIAPAVLKDVPGTLCAPFEAESWRSALDEMLADRDRQISGRAAAERYSARRTAEWVRRAWQKLR